MRKKVSVEDVKFLHWVDSIDSDDADYLDDWFNLAEHQEYDWHISMIPSLKLFQNWELNNL